MKVIRIWITVLIILANVVCLLADGLMGNKYSGTCSIGGVTWELEMAFESGDSRGLADARLGELLVIGKHGIVKKHGFQYQKQGGKITVYWDNFAYEEAKIDKTEIKGKVLINKDQQETTNFHVNKNTIKATALSLNIGKDNGREISLRKGASRAANKYRQTELDLNKAAEKAAKDLFN